MNQSETDIQEPKDRSAVWGTAVVVLLFVLSLILLAYFVWYAPVMHAQQTEAGIRGSARPTPSPTAEAPDWKPRDSETTTGDIGPAGAIGL